MERMPSMESRELLVRVDGAGSDAGSATVLAYRVGSRIEIVATEEGDGDAAVLLSASDALALARALVAATEPADGV
jgi:hypothetical protein